MLRNIFLKTLRDYFRQIIIWGGGSGLLMLFYGLAYNSVFGTGPDQAKTIEDYRKTVEAFTILTGKVYDIDTFGGFINTKIGSALPVLFSIWALMVGSGLIRGEEERGSLELLSTTPRPRTTVLLEKWAGLVVALLAILFLSWVGLILGAIASQAELSPLDAALTHLNWGLLALGFGGLALLLSQLTSRKNAAFWTGGFVAASYLLNNLLLNLPALEWTRYIYPFYYASLSQPLARSVGTNWLGVVVLALIPIPLIAGALAMYLRRDLGGFFAIRENHQPAVSDKFREVKRPAVWWLSNSFVFELRSVLPGVLIWGLGISVYTVLIMSAFQDIKTSMVDMLRGNDFFAQLGFGTMTSNENILSLFIFVFLVLLVAAHAVVQVSSWTAEENEGRLEMLLSTPQPRWRILLVYFGVAVFSSALMITLLGAVFAFCCWGFNIPVNTGNAFGAFFGLWVVCTVIEAIGFVMAAFGPQWAVGITGGLVIISYFTDLLQQVLKLPQLVVDLSVFHQYGRPLSEGLHWTPQLVMIVFSVLFIIIAAIRFRQRDINS